MTGESNLSTLIRGMEPTVTDQVFAFLSIPTGSPVPGGIVPIMMFREQEGLTLVVPRDQAEAAGLPSAFPSRMITLTIHSALEAVGFLAAITARLAAAGIAVNAVSAFHHDHLFVPETRANDALALLRTMTGGV